MNEKVTHADPSPGQLITELHCWVATYPDGTEGIMAHGLEGIGMAPLLSSRLDLAQAMEPVARQVQYAMRYQANRILQMRLVTFTSTEGTRQ